MEALASNPQFLVWLSAICSLSLLAYIARITYGYLRDQRRKPNIIDSINSMLPQTQCGQCGHPGCLPYAEAIARGTPFNQCPPGGQTTIRRLAALLAAQPRRLNPAHGEELALRVAVIREAECIGCTKCIQACPVDAILGGPKLMHTIISSECTGCDLCVDPCPVDCIDMLPTEPAHQLQLIGLSTKGQSLPTRVSP